LEEDIKREDFIRNSDVKADFWGILTLNQGESFFGDQTNSDLTMFDATKLDSIVQSIKGI
jgi:hypothetical protein